MKKKKKRILFKLSREALELNGRGYGETTVHFRGAITGVIKCRKKIDKRKMMTKCRK